MGFRLETRDVAHFPARPGLVLTVKVKAGSGFRGEPLPGFDIGADEVCHHGIGMACGGAQRLAGHRADVILELADGAGVSRPVP